MISRILYSDRKIEAMEEIQRWYETIEYLKKLYVENVELPVAEEILALAIFQCWYTYNVLPDTAIRYQIFEDIIYYKETWRRLISVGLDRYYDSPHICWMIGYTAFTENIHFYSHLKRFGEDMMKRGISLSNLDLPYDILSGKKRRYQNDLYLIRPKILFPSNSAADKYFRKKLEDTGLTFG